MRYRADNSGNLYRAEGGWRLRFRPEDFKNLNGAAKDKPYDVEIHRSVWPTIEEWIGEYRSRLDRTHSDYVFMSSHKHYQGQPWGGMTHTVLLQTRRFLSSTDGIGPHAFRHLVATTWLRMQPGSYQRVAVLLHDTLETVLKTYGHMTVSAGFDQ
jgi:integrase